MDVLYFIKAEHESVRSALEGFRSAHGVTDRREKFSALKQLLSVHLKLEENYLYPELSGMFAGSELVIDVALAGHSILARNLDAIDKLLHKPLAAQDGIAKKEEALFELVVKHIDSQEHELMPRIRELIATGAREELGFVLLDAKEELMGSAEPVSAAPDKVKSASSDRSSSGKAAAKVAGKRRA